MSSTTILELRQEDAFSGLQPLPNGEFQNGVWETTLDVPIQLNEGDQVQVKSVYLDTSIGQSGYISVPSDINVRMSAAMYITNYEKDQEVLFREPGASASPPAEPASRQLRLYPLGVGKTNPLPHHNLGDNNKWFLSTLTTSNADTFRLPKMTMILPKISRARAGASYVSGVWTFKYTSVEPGAPRWNETFQLVLKRPFRWDELHKYNPFTVGISCAHAPGNTELPDFRFDNYDGHPELNTTTFDWLSYKVSVGTGTESAQLQTFPLEFTIPGGVDVVYSPIEIAKLITDNLINLEQEGQASIDYANAGKLNNTMVSYPAMNPFLTTVLKNHSEIQARGVAQGTNLEQVFINADGYQNAKFAAPDVNNPDGNQNGNLQMKYDITSMLAEKMTNLAGQQTHNAQDYWIGSNEIALEFDESVNKLKFTQQHFPVYSGDTTLPSGDSALDALPSAVYNPCETLNPYFSNKGLITQYSGLVWTELSPPSFWNSILGFNGLVSQPNGNQGFMKVAGAPDAPPPTVPNSFELIVTEGVNTTGALPSIDVGVVHSNAGFSTPIQADPTIAKGEGGMSVPVIIQDVLSIFSQRTWNTSPATEGYFLLDIATNFQQNMIGSTLKNTSTQSIVNRYYTADSFTSDQGQGSIVYEHKGEPQMLSSFRVKVLNPDRTLTAEHILQPKNTVFIEVIKPLVSSTPKKQ